MMDTKTITAPRWRLRRKLMWSALIACPFIFLLAWLGYEWFQDHELKAAIAEADRLDPGWRLADLEAARAEIPDEDNAALQVLAAARLIPPGWIPTPLAGMPTLEEELDHVIPQSRLDQNLNKQLRADLAKASPALSTALRVANMPRGHYDINWTPDAIGTVLTHADQAQKITWLLRLDAIRRVEDGDTEGALVTCRALFNLGGSFGDEPIAISQLIRRSRQGLALRCLERALAQGQASEPVLASLQRLLEDEESHPLLLIAARGERAGIHQFLEYVEAGHPYRANYGLRSQTGIDNLDEFLDRGKARGCHTAFLHYLNECVEIAKLPPEQQIERLRSFEKQPPQDVPQLLAALSGPLDSFQKLARIFHHGLAFLRCGIVAVAIERFRLANSRWPGQLEELTPGFLGKVPSDPFDPGAPGLRYRRLKDGVIIYSVGEDRKDDGGRRVLIKPGAPDADVGFQLWDPEHRRQPAGHE